MLPGAVEHLDVLELHADARPQRHGLGGVVLVPSLDRAVGVRSAHIHTNTHTYAHTDTHIHTHTHTSRHTYTQDQTLIMVEM